MIVKAKIIVKDGNSTDNPNLAGCDDIKVLSYDNSFLDSFKDGNKFYIIDAASFQRMILLKRVCYILDSANVVDWRKEL